MEARLRALILPVLVSAVAAGCSDGGVGGSPGPHLVSTDTVGGVVHISNAGPGAWSAGEAWTFEVQWTVGSLDGPPEEIFGRGPYITAIGPSGYVHVSASRDRLIRAFDRDGNFVRQIGTLGGGEGPGEFLLVAGMVWDHDGRMWVLDFSRRRYIVFDSVGVLVGEIPRPIRGSPNWVELARFDHSGHLVDAVIMSWTAEETARIGFLRVAPDGQVVDTLPPMEAAPWTNATAMASRQPMATFILADLSPYRPRLRFSFGPDDTIWLNSGSGDRIQLVQRTFQGDTLRVVEADHRQGVLSTEDEARIADILRRAGEDRSDYELARQIVQAIHVTGDGHVLVRIEEQVGEASGVFDVFDPDGHFLGTLELPFGLPPSSIARFRGDTLIAPFLDDDHVPRFARVVLLR